MIRTALEQLIVDACKELGISDPKVNLEHPEDIENGEFSSNIAMVYAKTLSMSPLQLAEKIAHHIQIKNSQYIQDIKVAAPGFLNFYLPASYFNTVLSAAMNEKSFGESSLHSGETLLVEHSSPNLFKPFHIGHVMNNAIGESIARLAKSSGADITVISYPSDVSLGIGKAVWAMIEDGKEKLETIKTESEKLAYFGDAYVRGTQALEAQPDLLPRMQEITKLIYEKIPSPEYDVYQMGKDINLNYFKEITERLGSHFDGYIYESEAGAEGKKLVEEHMGDVFEKSDGAIIYAGEKDGLHTRVFINKEGYPTYEAKDVGLLSLKFKKYAPDISLFVTDHQQKEYFKVVSFAAGKIDERWKNKTKHLTHGRMTFKGQKMSSRLGGVPVAVDVLNLIESEVSEKASTLDVKERDTIAIAALKFSILRAGLGKNINFDPDTSLSFEGDSGPYLQYTAVRAKSVVHKAKEMLKALPVVNPNAQVTLLTQLISRFPEIVEYSIREWEPHYVSTYLLSLAQAFNSWYATGKIVDKKNEHIGHELALAQATSRVLTQGLYLLGISIPEKM